jgi:hypothetical protein
LMHLAVAKHDVKAVVKLIMQGANVNAIDLKTGDTPLHLLINNYMKNQVAANKILTFLVNAGADLNTKNND